MSFFLRSVTIFCGTVNFFYITVSVHFEKFVILIIGTLYLKLCEKELIQVF